MAAEYNKIIILTVLMLVSFLFSSCRKTNEPAGKEEDEKIYENIPLSVNRIEGNYRITTSPDVQLIISEDIDLETTNSFGGATNFKRLYLTGWGMGTLF